MTRRAERRGGAGPNRRGRFRIGSGPADVAYGVGFASGAHYARGVAGQFANDYRRLRTIWAPDQIPPVPLAFVCGLDSGGGGSILLGTQADPGYPAGKVLGFDGVYSVPGACPQHTILTGEVGRYVVDDLWIDGAFMYHARNGRLLNVRRTDVDVSWSSANPFAINCRPTGVPPTFQFGALTVFDIQLSTVTPSLATVLSDAQLPPGVPIGGALNRWTGTEGITAATWTDQISGRVLTFGGAPTLGVRRSRFVRSCGMVSVFTDSNGIREPVGLSGNAWRKFNLENIVAAGVACTANGKFAGGSASTLDFDDRNTATGGQALAVNNGAVVAAQTTLAADLAAPQPAGVTTDGSFVLAYGVNDSFVYCVTMAMSAADATTAFLAALDAAIALIGPHQPGRPLVIVTPLRLATGVSTATQRSFLDLVYAALPAFIAARVGVYPGLRLADTRAAVTPTQADADNVSILYDGTHMTLAAMPLYARPISDAILSAI